MAVGAVVKRPKRRWSRRLSGGAIALGVVAALLAWLVPAVRSARNAARSAATT
jgi:hypothetical protein